MKEPEDVKLFFDLTPEVYCWTYQEEHALELFEATIHPAMHITP
jgi:hypothetical protein